MLYAVIMAGGIGSRFWPESRRDHPKQFLNVFDDATLIQNTVARLQGIIPPERCLILTHTRYIDETKQQLPAIPDENILAEPISRNTAPCIAYAATVLKERDPDATMAVLPADHIIKDVKRFHEVLEVAEEAAQSTGRLVTIGIHPTHPETGYGYIQVNGDMQPADDSLQALPVRTFAEKPDVATAERFLDSGDFLWNSGMFIWRVDSILDAMKQHLPKLEEAFRAEEEQVVTGDEEAVRSAFSQSPSISIDYGVMERAEDVYVVPASFGWSDVGDWRAVYELHTPNDHGNVVKGNVIMHDSSRSFVQGDDRLVVLVGVHDTIVVDTEDAILICNKESTQQVKNVVEYLHAHQLEEYV